MNNCLELSEISCFLPTFFHLLFHVYRFKCDHVLPTRLIRLVNLIVLMETIRCKNSRNWFTLFARIKSQSICEETYSNLKIPRQEKNRDHTLHLNEGEEEEGEEEGGEGKHWKLNDQIFEHLSRRMIPYDFLFFISFRIGLKCVFVSLFRPLHSRINGNMFSYLI